MSWNGMPHGLLPRLSLNFSAELEDAAHGEEDEVTWSSCLIAAFGVISRTFAVCSKTSCLPEMAQPACQLLEQLGEGSLPEVSCSFEYCNEKLFHLKLQRCHSIWLKKHGSKCSKTTSLIEIGASRTTDWGEFH